MSRVVLSITCFIWAAWAAQAGVREDAQRAYNHTDYAGAIQKLGGAADPQSLLLLGQTYFMQGEFRKASNVLDRVVAADPQNSNAYLWRGRAYGRRAETAFAIAAPALASKARINFERAVALNPRNWDAIGDLFEYYLEAPGFLGGGVDKAAKLVDLIAQHDLSEASAARARIAEQRKEFGTAEEQLRRAVQLAPEQVNRLVALARFLAKRDRYEESDQAFRQALQAAPEKPEVVYNRARTLIETNRNLPEARGLLKKYLALSLGPDDPPKQDAEKLLRKASGG